LEDIANDDPVKLQSGFQTYDECGTKSKKQILIFGYKRPALIYTILEYDDDCDTASEIFTCAADKIPTIAQGMVDDGNSNTSIVI